MTWVWGPSFPIEGFWGSPDAKAQDWWGQALWGRAVYTALHGARLSSVPSGDQSANPASVPGRSGLQQAFLSVSSAQKCSGAGRLAAPSGVSRAARSAVPCRSSVPGHRASRSKYTRGQSQETGFPSKSSGGVGALAKRVLLGPAWADSGSLVFLEMTRVWGPSFPIGDF